MTLPISSGAALAIAILLEVTGTTALQMFGAAHEARTDLGDGGLLHRQPLFHVARPQRRFLSASPTRSGVGSASS